MAPGASSSGEVSLLCCPKLLDSSLLSYNPGYSCRARSDRALRLGGSTCRQAYLVVLTLLFLVVSGNVLACDTADLEAEFMKNTPYRRLRYPVSKLKSRHGKGKC